MFCEKCYEKAIKAAPSIRQAREKGGVARIVYERVELPGCIDHGTMKDNAIFLLDLAPLTNPGKSFLIKYIHISFFHFLV